MAEQIVKLLKMPTQEIFGDVKIKDVFGDIRTSETESEIRILRLYLF